MWNVPHIITHPEPRFNFSPHQFLPSSVSPLLSFSPHRFLRFPLRSFSTSQFLPSSVSPLLSFSPPQFPPFPTAVSPLLSLSLPRFLPSSVSILRSFSPPPFLPPPCFPKRFPLTIHWPFNKITSSIIQHLYRRISANWNCSIVWSCPNAANWFMTFLCYFVSI